MLNLAEIKFRRIASELFWRRMVTINLVNPIISFSFDDAPQTAFRQGGFILKFHRARATFFVSIGLINKSSPSGAIASYDDLRQAIDDGHELGCHTFDHKDPWRTTTEDFALSIDANLQALSNFLPKAIFKTFAYPFSGPKPSIKRRVGNIFDCCRGGGQTFNARNADLNLLKSFFLDRRCGNSLETVKNIIDQNSKLRGWLIFATHDIQDKPSPYGCNAEFFEKVVEYASRSSRILTIGEACHQIQLN